MPEMLDVGSKLVLPSEPYLPPASAIGELVGRDLELRLVAAAWMCGPGSPPLGPVLVGPAGVGKNRIVYELARRTGRDLYIFQGHEDVTAEDLSCAVRFSDEGGGKMDYVVSPLVTAMRRGGILFFDEIGKIRPRALAPLVSVLGARRYIDSTLLGARVHASPRFRFVAATNTGEIEALPEFIRSRLRPVIRIGQASHAEIERIVATRFPAIRKDSQSLFEAFWEGWGRHSGNETPPTPREALHVFGLARSLADLEELDGDDAFRRGGNGSPFPLESRNGGARLEVRHLDRALVAVIRGHSAGQS